MKTAAIALFFTLFAASLLTADHHTAASLDESIFQIGSRLGLVANGEKIDLLADIRGDYRGEDPFYRSFTAGSYYRVHRNVKAGAFYTLQAGKRHDDDWEEENGEWSWEETDNRFESILAADITPRFLLPRLPGRNWVFSVKNRYSLNFHNSHQKYLLLPGLSWFGIKDRIPVVNLNAGYGLYFPLNFSDSLLYQQGPWLSGLYHLTEQIKLEMTGQYLRTNWTVENSGESETVTTETFRIVLGVLWTPRF